MKGGSSKFRFTFKRLGYNPLPFFSDEEDDKLLTYKFLENYDFVIEPSADMRIHSYNAGANISDSTYFKYTICSSGELKLNSNFIDYHFLFIRL